jgi:hypothetical protein
VKTEANDAGASWHRFLVEGIVFAVATSFIGIFLRETLDLGSRIGHWRYFQCRFSLLRATFLEQIMTAEAWRWSGAALLRIIDNESQQHGVAEPRRRSRDGRHV